MQAIIETLTPAGSNMKDLHSVAEYRVVLGAWSFSRLSRH